MIKILGQGFQKSDPGNSDAAIHQHTAHWAGIRSADHTTLLRRQQYGPRAKLKAIAVTGTHGCDSGHTDTSDLKYVWDCSRESLRRWCTLGEGVQECSRTWSR